VCRLNQIERDNEGYLLDPLVWDEDLALEFALELDIQLTDYHWLIIRFVRQFYEEQQSVPEARVLLRYLKNAYSHEFTTRRFLYSLFPYGYGQQACKIAGMRKPLKLILDV